MDFNFMVSPIKAPHDPNDLFCFADGSRLRRSELEGKIYRGAFKILYVGTRAHWEALHQGTTNSMEI